MKKTKEIEFILINFVVACVTIIYFFRNYYHYTAQLYGNIYVLGIALLTTVIVNMIKMFRIYIAFYGQNINLFSIAKIYSKTTIVSAILPYKMGELFRMYCYGKKVKSAQKGIIVVLLDRFMDTIGVLTVIVASDFWNKKDTRHDSIEVLLLFFVSLMFVIYIIFPGLASFWKKYLLKANASKHKLWALEMLERINGLYIDINNVIKGRGIIMVTLSIVAWIVEVASLKLFCGYYGIKEKIDISAYLKSILRGEINTENARYTVACVFIMTVSYLLLSMIEIKKHLKKVDKT